ncbi:MAG: GIY-YIG nuclease family protein [Proteobacteria bacterium]|nr:GIY-YIG nuclease family protein [Pseudomonadota bacterium]
MSKVQQIYFIKPIGLAGPIKIGCSVWPCERVSQVMTWSPLPLELVHSFPGGFEVERQIHRCFADLHSHREWFHAGDRLLNAIEKIKSGVPLQSAIDLHDDRGSIRKGQWGKKSIPADLVGYRSYAARCRNAERRAGEKAGERRIFPEDVRLILSAWEGRNGYRMPRNPVRPSEEQLSRLDEVLSDPHRYCIRPDWLVQKEAA